MQKFELIKRDESTSSVNEKFISPNFRREVLTKYLFTAFTLSTIILKSFGQTEKRTIIPPSPSVMEMEKYTNYNVGIQNGVASFSIPIYTLKVGDLELPLALEYSSSAVKYDFSLNDLGVNWRLSDMGFVSRTIYGKADETDPKPTEEELKQLGNATVGGQDFVGGFISDSGFPKYYDGQYDRFRYSTMGRSGEFIMENFATKKVLSTVRGDKISFNVDGVFSRYYVTDLQITNDRGVKYYYGKDPNNPNTYSINKQPNGPEPTMWYTTKIEGNKNEYISFSYVKKYETQYIQPTYGTVTESYQPVTDPLVSTIFQGFIYNVGENIPIETQAIKEIISSTGEKIVFNRSSTDRKLLNSIDIMDSSNKLIKKVVLIYSGTAPTLLKTVRISGASGTLPLSYNFKYNDEAKFVNKYDSWGYLNESGMYIGQFPQFSAQMLEKQRFSASSGGTGDYQHLTLQQLSNFNMVNIPELNRANDYYLLNEIEFPTGGKRNFEYESHKYIDQNGQVRSFGARIKKIKSFERTGSGATLVKNYRYGNQDAGIGLLFSDLSDERYFFTERPIVHIILSTAIENYKASLAKSLTIHSVNPYHNFLDQMGNILYTKVSEYDVIENFDGVVQQEKGKQVHNFLLPGLQTPIGIFGDGYYSSPGEGTFPSAIFPNYYMRPQNLGISVQEYATEFYDKVDNVFRLVRRVENKFKSGIFLEQNELLVSPLWHSSAGGIYKFSRPFGTGIVSSTGFNNIADYKTYIFRVGESELVEKQITTDFSGNMLKDSTKSQVENIYNNFDILKQRKSTDSDDGYTVEDYRYANDFNNQFLVGKNIIGVPLEEKASYLKNSISKLRKKQTTNYPLNKIQADSLTGGMALPISVQLTDLISGTQYKDIVYDKYDSKGNPLQYTIKSGMPVSIVWGYGERYPIAMVENAKQSSKRYDKINSSTTRNMTIGYPVPNGSTKVEQSFSTDYAGTITIALSHYGTVDGEFSYQLNGPLTKGENFYSFAGAPKNIVIPNCPKGNYTLTVTLAPGEIIEETPSGDYASFTVGYPVISEITSIIDDFYLENFENMTSGITKVSANTGKNSYSGNSSFQPLFNGISNKKYLIQWWSLKDNKWVFNQQDYVANMMLYGQIDDVRIFPKSAKVTTFTYDSSVGMTSKINEQGGIEIYEYDGMMRLIRVLDQDKNVLKSFDYHFRTN